MGVSCPPDGFGRRARSGSNGMVTSITPPKAVISIVDDDESVREAVMDLMRSLGFTTEAYARGEDFLKSDRLQTTCCLIADVQLPGMSGPELHRRLVASGTAIPTVLITAYPDDAVRTRALEAGVVGYLTKPFSHSELLGCINSALQRRKAS
jgi:FixJ family two-component response regulator